MSAGDGTEGLADELRRVRESARSDPPSERPAREVLPAARAPRAPERVPQAAEPAPPPAPAPPDGSHVNASWDVGARLPGGLLGRLARLLLGPFAQAQTAFNSRQVQLDNDLLAYLDARFERTHRHYDEVLGVHGRHLRDVDQRHLQLQEDLVAHVHDLVERIDLVLGEGERSRVGLEFALRDLRARLERLEETVRAQG